MITMNDLQSLKLFSAIDESKLRKVKEITFIRRFEKNQVIFREGQYAESLFAVLDGKVSLQIRLNSSNSYRIKDIYPGRVFGISSVVDTENRSYIADAIAQSDTKVCCWKSSDLEKLFYFDFELGFQFMRRIGKILKTRLESKRAQLVQEFCKAD